VWIRARLYKFFEGPTPIRRERVSANEKVSICIRLRFVQLQKKRESTEQNLKVNDWTRTESYIVVCYNCMLSLLNKYRFDLIYCV
jgi:hypothetical protein